MTQCIYPKHSARGFSVQDFCTLAASAFERLPGAFSIVSIPEYRLVYANDTTLNIVKDMGIDDPLRMLGEHPWDVFPGWKESMLPVYEDVCSTQEVRHIEYHRYVGTSGVTFWDLVLIPSIDQVTKKVASVAVIGTDVTERVRAMQLNDALVRINAAITSTLDFDSIMSRVVEEGTKALCAESGEVGIREGSKLVARYVYGDIPELFDAHLYEEEFPLSALALRTRQPVVVNDALSDERLDTVLVERFHLRSLLILPLIARNRVLGAISFHHHSTAVSFPQVEIDFAIKLATSASLALDNAKLFKTLRDELDQRKRAEKDLQRYHLFFQSSRDGMFMARLDGRVIAANDVVSEMYGYSYDEIVNLNIRDFRPPDLRDSVRKQVEALKKRGNIYESTGQRKDGSTFPIEVNARVAEIGGESVVIGVVRDISERKRVEAELRRSEHKFRSIFDNVGESIIIYDTEHHLIDVNRIAVETSGYTKEELLRMTANDFNPTGRASEIEEHTKEALEKGSVLFESTLFRKDGSILPVEVSVRYIEYDGRPAELAVARDISRRKQGEDALRQSEERFRAIFNGAAIGIALATPDRRIFTSNAAYQKLLGYTQEELAEMSFADYTYSEDIDIDQQLFTELVAGTRDYYQIEKRYVRKDGQIIWGRLTASIVRTPDGDLQFAIGMTEDITDRVQAIRELDEERQRLRTVLDVLPVGVFIADSDGSIVDINYAVRTVWGANAPLTERISAYVEYKGWWADSGKMLQSEDWALARALTNGDTSIGEMIDIERFDGTRATILNSAVPIRDSDGNITGAVAVVQDISALRQLERRATDLAARESEARSTLQAILDTAPTGIIVAQANGEISYFSRGTVDILGGPVTGTAAGPGAGSYQILCNNGFPCPPEDMPLVSSLAHGEYLRNMELVIRRVDGSEVSILAHSAPIRNEQGQVIAAVCTMTDITEIVRLRRELEETLEREEHFSHMLQQALLPIIPSVVDGYSVASLYIPAFISREIGGDFFDLFETREGNIGVLIGDVSGKGLEAAAFAAATRSTIHAFAYEMASPGDALTHANLVLSSAQEAFGLFVTVFLVIIDSRTGDVRYSSAGHPPAAIAHSDRSVEFLEFGDPPIGVFPGYEFNESECSLDFGEKIVLYTDGITEARQDFELFGTDGVKSVLKEYGHCSPGDLIGRLVESATEYAHGHLRDDTAVLVAERCSRDGTNESTTVQLSLSID